MTAALRCELILPSVVTAGEPVELSVRIANPDADAVAILGWGMPFEGMWSGPSVTVERDGAPVAYRGPMVKRGAPAAEEYVRIGARGMAEAALRLDAAFDLLEPGRYRVVPRFVLYDVVRGAAPIPSPLARMREEPLRCPERLLEVLPAR